MTGKKKKTKKKQEETEIELFKRAISQDACEAVTKVQRLRIPDDALEKFSVVIRRALDLALSDEILSCARCTFSEMLRRVPALASLQHAFGGCNNLRATALRSECLLREKKRTVIELDKIV